MNTRQNCPICDHTVFEPVLTAKDYTVSNDYFEIVACKKCHFQFTNPIPEEDKIGDYYKSESYVSHSSTNKGIINKLYQKVRKRTLRQKTVLVKRLTKGKRVLDIGSGTGHFVNACQEAGLDVVGLEPDADARAFGKKEFGIELRELSDLYELQENSQDAITMWHVLEHVYHLKDDVRQMVKVLADDGTLIVAVPNRNSYDAKHYKEYWAAYDLPIHLYHFVPEDIRNLFGQFNMEVVEILPMKYDAYYVSMLSEKYKGGNILKAAWNGWRSNQKAKEGTWSSQIYILKKKSI